MNCCKEAVYRALLLNNRVGGVAATTLAPTTLAPTTRAPTTPVPTTRATTAAPATREATTPKPTTRAATTTRGPITPTPSTRGPTTPPPTTRSPSTPTPTTTTASTPPPTSSTPTVPRTTLAPTTLAPTTRTTTYMDDGGNDGGQTDPCALADATLLGRSPTSGDSYFMPLASLRACMLNTRITHASAIWTLHNLLYGVAETYSFTDLVVDSVASEQSNDCGHRVHPVKVELEALIGAQISDYDKMLSGQDPDAVNEILNEERPAYEFHSNLLNLFNRLHDAHTSYATPYDMFRVYFPFNFGSRMQDGRQVVTLRYTTDPAQSLGRLAFAYQRLFGTTPLPTRYNDTVITLINNMCPMEYLRSLVADDGPLAASYQQTEQRLNAYIFTSPLLVLSQVLSNLPDYDAVTLRFEDGYETSVNLMGQFADLSTSPYYSVPNLRSTAALSSYLHSNPAFNAFVGLESDLEAKKPTLWKYASAAAAAPIIHGGRIMSSVHSDRLAQLSKKHKALLDPVRNHLRDNLLNVPLPIDPLEDDSSPHRAVFANATVLDKVIKETLASSEGGASPAGALRFNTAGGFTYAITGDTMVIRIPSMVPEPRAQDDKNFYYFPDFVVAQRAAIARNVSRLLVDVSSNGGGYIVSAYALLWYLMADADRICAPLRVRVTPNWKLWLDSFGSGIAATVDTYLGPKGDDLADEIDQIFANVSALVTLVYDGLGYTQDVLGASTKAVSLAKVEAAKQSILAKPNKGDRADAIRAYLKDRSFIPDDAEVKDSLLPVAGFTPFDPTEFVRPHTAGETFLPLLSNYKQPQSRNWGRPANYSQPGEYAWCGDVLLNMPTVAAGYRAGYWTQVAFVTDGTCGSACALFTQAIQTNGDAVGFTYGGAADTALDVASFAGGNVEEYNDFWPTLAFAAKLGELVSGGAAPWAAAHEHTWVAHPIAFPTKASARFNWNMMFSEAMGDAALPRQFYLMPGRKHFNVWPNTDTGRADLYAQIAAIPDWAAIPAQFKDSHGQCPLEANPFARRQAGHQF